MNTENCLRTTAVTAAPALPFRGGLRAARTLLQTWHQRARERRELLQLDERQLRDIGVRAEDVLREAHKPFWRK